MNIIITNVGRRGYLVDYIKSVPGFSGKVFVSDCDRTASGLYGHNDGHFILPRPVDNPEKYVSELERLCHEIEISVVVPVIDPEIFILSKYRQRLKEKGITAIVSDERTLDICYDKIKMNDFLGSCGIQYPNTYASFEAFERAMENGDIKFPIIMKPILGSGSVDTYKLDNMEKSKALFSVGLIIQPFLSGLEYGIDVFNDFNGNSLRCVIKEKLSMRSGETDKSLSVHNEAIQMVALKIAESLKHIGNLDCDMMETENGVYVLDMNPRFGGGYPATHTIGVNLLELLIMLCSGENVVPEFNNYPTGILVMKDICVKAVRL